MVELNATNSDYLVQLGKGNITEQVYAWLVGTTAFLAMTGVMTVIMFWMVWFSWLISELADAGLLSMSSGLTLSTLSSSDYNQTQLTDISEKCTGAASSKGFGGSPATPPIPGFELLFVLIPLGMLVAVFAIHKKRKLQAFA